MVNISQFWGPTKSISFISGQRWGERGLLSHNQHNMSGCKLMLLSYSCTLLKPLKKPICAVSIDCEWVGNVTWRGESEMQPHYSLSIIGTGPPTPSPLCLADISGYLYIWWHTPQTRGESDNEGVKSQSGSSGQWERLTESLDLRMGFKIPITHSNKVR